MMFYFVKVGDECLILCVDNGNMVIWLMWMVVVDDGGNDWFGKVLGRRLGDDDINLYMEMVMIFCYGWKFGY